MDKCELCDIRSLTVADRGMRDVNVMLVCDMCWAVQEQGLSEWAQDDEMHRSYMRGIEDSRRYGEEERWSGERSMLDLYVAPVDTPRPTRTDVADWVHVDTCLGHYGYRSAHEEAADWAESVRRASDVHAVYADELTRMAREDGL